jgi:hypothetical protein
MSLAGSGQLDELCAGAATAARAQGHDLGGWTAPPGERRIARAAQCRLCGRVAYVRVAPGMAGATGEALRERCDAGPPPGR